MSERCIIFGGGGFLGNAINWELETFGFDTISITRKKIDLSDVNCINVVSDTVRDGDIVVLAAAKAPAKSLEEVFENISLLNNVIEGLKGKELAYLLNVSSDAVFGDPKDLISERSEMAPQSAHGVMHCMREKMIEQASFSSFGHIRPTLVFGSNDPHNGYGPNSFIRRAKNGQNIELFGEGEELRDHIFVEDVAKMSRKMIEKKFAGGVNAVTGSVISFWDLAETVLRSSVKPISITNKQRSGPMPHGGYRAFDNQLAMDLMGGSQFKQVKTYIEESFTSHG